MTPEPVGQAAPSPGRELAVRGGGRAAPRLAQSAGTNVCSARRQRGAALLQSPGGSHRRQAALMGPGSGGWAACPAILPAPWRSGSAWAVGRSRERIAQRASQFGTRRCRRTAANIWRQRSAKRPAQFCLKMARLRTVRLCRPRAAQARATSAHRKRWQGTLRPQPASRAFARHASRPMERHTCSGRSRKVGDDEASVSGGSVRRPFALAEAPLVSPRRRNQRGGGLWRGERARGGDCAPR